MSVSGVRPSALSTALVASACALLLAGCGVGSNLTAPASDVTATRGIVHGGPNPVVGATVTLYATNAAATTYGAAATSIGSATTGSDGSFNITLSGSCPSGQQAYITAAGGDPGSGTNANYLLMAALGDCSTLTGNSVWVDEVTTVAAAYALNNFMTISGTTVNIGAPTANNSASPACTGTGSSMTCTAAGLAHAFQNALNLANSFGASPNGQAYTVTPSNSNGSVPAAVINSIADAVEACVNSKGGTAGDGSSCGNLFTATTPPGGSTAPTNTLAALVNLAQNPTSDVGGIYSLGSPISYYQPALSAAPADWSLAIVYTGVNGTNFGTVRSVALDAADNVYAPSYSTSAAATVLGSMTSNGTSNYVYTDSTYTYPEIVAVDANGNAFFSNEGSSTHDPAIVEVTSAGALKQALAIGTPYYPYGVAVDLYNNVYTVTNAKTGGTIFLLPAGGTAVSQVSVGSAGAYSSSLAYPINVAVDPDGDVWDVSNTSGSTGTDTLLSSTTSGTATPAFSAVTTTSEDAANGYGYGILFLTGGTSGTGSAWISNETTLYEVPITPKSQSGGTVTAAVVGSPTTIGTIKSGSTTAYKAEFPAMDGGGNIFLPDYNAATSYLWEYSAAAGTFTPLAPCAAPGGATSCNSGTTAGTYAALYNPNDAAVDSTGSVWVSNYTAAQVTQVIGVATPSWPLLSYAHSGQEPK